MVGDREREDIYLKELNHMILQLAGMKSAV